VKLDRIMMEEYSYQQNITLEKLEKNIIDIMKLQMKLAEKNNVDFDKEYYETKIKKYNEK
jgi:hypothetical protein